MRNDTTHTNNHAGLAAFGQKLQHVMDQQGVNKHTLERGLAALITDALMGLKEISEHGSTLTVQQSPPAILAGHREAQSDYAQSILAPLLIKCAPSEEGATALLHELLKLQRPEWTPTKVKNKLIAPSQLVDGWLNGAPDMQNPARYGDILSAILYPLETNPYINDLLFHDHPQFKKFFNEQVSLKSSDHVAQASAAGRTSLQDFEKAIDQANLTLIGAPPPAPVEEPKPASNVTPDPGYQPWIQRSASRNQDTLAEARTNFSQQLEKMMDSQDISLDQFKKALAQAITRVAAGIATMPANNQETDIAGKDKLNNFMEGGFRAVQGGEMLRTLLRAKAHMHSPDSNTTPDRALSDSAKTALINALNDPVPAACPEECPALERAVLRLIEDTKLVENWLDPESEINPINPKPFETTLANILIKGGMEAINAEKPLSVAPKTARQIAMERWQPPPTPENETDALANIGAGMGYIISAQSPLEQYGALEESIQQLNSALLGRTID